MEGITKMTIKCPVCRGLQVGKVGTDQFYCWNCFLEFNFSKGHAHIFEVGEDGTLVSVEDVSAARIL
jgi:hypothetical protein